MVQSSLDLDPFFREILIEIVFVFSESRLILMVLGPKIFLVEDEYGVKRFRHFQALFILFSGLGAKEESS